MDQRPCLEQATIEKCLECLWCDLQVVSDESILLDEIALAEELWYFVQVEPLVLESVAYLHLVSVKPAGSVPVLGVGSLLVAIILCMFENFLLVTEDLNLPKHECMVFCLDSEVSISQHSTTHIKICNAKHGSIDARLRIIVPLNSLNQLVHSLLSFLQLRQSITEVAEGYPPLEGIFLQY